MINFINAGETLPALPMLHTSGNPGNSSCSLLPIFVKKRRILEIMKIPHCKQSQVHSSTFKL